MLTDNEKFAVATGLVLCGDYLKGCEPDVRTHPNITAYICSLVEKLGVSDAFSKACAETSDIGRDIQRVTRERRTP